MIHVLPSTVRPRPHPRLQADPALGVRRPRVLYFDIDGTLVRPTFGRAKRALARGRFERLVRAAGFDRLVCVSDAVLIARALAPHAASRRERLLTLFRFCRGTIRDWHWFRTHVDLVRDPTRRAAEIDPAHDWYYVDDHAWRHLVRIGPVQPEAAARTLRCRGAGEGQDLAAWLRALRIDGERR